MPPRAGPPVTRAAARRAAAPDDDDDNDDGADERKERRRKPKRKAKPKRKPKRGGGGGAAAPAASEEDDDDGVVAVDETEDGAPMQDEKVEREGKSTDGKEREVKSADVSKGLSLSPALETKKKGIIGRLEREAVPYDENEGIPWKDLEITADCELTAAEEAGRTKFYPENHPSTAWGIHAAVNVRHPGSPVRTAARHIYFRYWDLLGNPVGPTAAETPHGRTDLYTVSAEEIIEYAYVCTMHNGKLMEFSTEFPLIRGGATLPDDKMTSPGMRTYISIVYMLAKLDQQEMNVRRTMTYVLERYPYWFSSSGSPPARGSLCMALFKLAHFVIDESHQAWKGDRTKLEELATSFKLSSVAVIGRFNSIATEMRVAISKLDILTGLPLNLQTRVPDRIVKYAAPEDGEPGVAPVGFMDVGFFHQTHAEKKKEVGYDRPYIEDPAFRDFWYMRRCLLKCYIGELGVVLLKITQNRELLVSADGTGIRRRPTFSQFWPNIVPAYMKLKSDWNKGCTGIEWIAAAYDAIPEEYNDHRRAAAMREKIEDIMVDVLGIDGLPVTKNPSRMISENYKTTSSGLSTLLDLYNNSREYFKYIAVIERMINGTAERFNIAQSPFKDTPEAREALKMRMAQDYSSARPFRVTDIINHTMTRTPREELPSIIRACLSIGPDCMNDTNPDKFSDDPEFCIFHIYNQIILWFDVNHRVPDDDTGIAPSGLSGIRFLKFADDVYGNYFQVRGMPNLFKQYLGALTDSGGLDFIVSPHLLENGVIAALEHIPNARKVLELVQLRRRGATTTAADVKSLRVALTASIGMAQRDLEFFDYVIDVKLRILHGDDGTAGSQWKLRRVTHLGYDTSKQREGYQKDLKRQNDAHLVEVASNIRSMARITRESPGTIDEKKMATLQELDDAAAGFLRWNSTRESRELFIRVMSMVSHRQYTELKSIMTRKREIDSGVAAMRRMADYHAERYRTWLIDPSKATASPTLSSDSKRSGPPPTSPFELPWPQTGTVDTATGSLPDLAKFEELIGGASVPTTEWFDYQLSEAAGWIFPVSPVAPVMPEPLGEYANTEAIAKHAAAVNLYIANVADRDMRIRINQYRVSAEHELARRAHYDTTASMLNMMAQRVPGRAPDEVPRPGPEPPPIPGPELALPDAEVRIAVRAEEVEQYNEQVREYAQYVEDLAVYHTRRARIESSRVTAENELARRAIDTQAEYLHGLTEAHKEDTELKRRYDAIISGKDESDPTLKRRFGSADDDEQKSTSKRRRGDDGKDVGTADLLSSPGRGVFDEGGPVYAPFANTRYLRFQLDEDIAKGGGSMPSAYTLDKTVGYLDVLRLATNPTTQALIQVAIPGMLGTEDAHAYAYRPDDLMAPHIGVSHKGPLLPDTAPIAALRLQEERLRADVDTILEEEIARAVKIHLSVRSFQIIDADTNYLKIFRDRHLEAKRILEAAERKIEAPKVLPWLPTSAFAFLSSSPAPTPPPATAATAVTDWQQVIDFQKSILAKRAADDEVIAAQRLVTAAVARKSVMLRSPAAAAAASAVTAAAVDAASFSEKLDARILPLAQRRARALYLADRVQHDHKVRLMPNGMDLDPESFENTRHLDALISNGADAKTLSENDANPEVVAALIIHNKALGEFKKQAPLKEVPADSLIARFVVAKLDQYKADALGGYEFENKLEHLRQKNDDEFILCMKNREEWRMKARSMATDISVELIPLLPSGPNREAIIEGLAPFAERSFGDATKYIMRWEVVLGRRLRPVDSTTTEGAIAGAAFVPPNTPLEQLWKQLDVLRGFSLAQERELSRVINRSRSFAYADGVGGEIVRTNTRPDGLVFSVDALDPSGNPRGQEFHGERTTADDDRSGREVIVLDKEKGGGEGETKIAEMRVGLWVEGDEAIMVGDNRPKYRRPAVGLSTAKAMDTKDQLMRGYIARAYVEYLALYYPFMTGDILDLVVPVPRFAASAPYVNRDKD